MTATLDPSLSENDESSRSPMQSFNKGPDVAKLPGGGTMHRLAKAARAECKVQAKRQGSSGASPAFPGPEKCWCQAAHPRFLAGKVQGAWRFILITEEAVWPMIFGRSSEIQ